MIHISPFALLVLIINTWANQVVCLHGYLLSFWTPRAPCSAQLLSASPLSQGLQDLGGCQDCKYIYHHSFISCLHLYSHHCSKHSQLFPADAITAAQKIWQHFSNKLLTRFSSIIISSRIKDRKNSILFQFRENLGQLFVIIGSQDKK